MILVGLGMLFLPAVTLGQVQAPKIQIHTDVENPKALLNLDLQALEESEQEVVSHRLVFLDQQSEADPPFEAIDISGGELPGRASFPQPTHPHIPLQNLLIPGPLEPSTNTDGLVGGRFRTLQQAPRDAQISLAILEGNSKTFTIKLGEQPSGEVTGTIMGYENTDIEVSPAQLMFDDSNWNVKQTVTVGVKQDSGDHEVKLTLMASGGGVKDSISINVRILDILPVPVNLSADQREVEKGEKLKMTGMSLSPFTRLTSGDVLLKFEKAMSERDGTSYNPVPKIPIPLDAKSAVTEIQIGEGTDQSNETFMVTRDGNLSPPGIELGSPSSVEGAINDGDRSRQFCLEVSPDWVAAGRWVTMKATVSPVQQADIEVSISFLGLSSALIDPTSITYDNPDKKKKLVTIPAGKRESASFRFKTRWSGSSSDDHRGILVGRPNAQYTHGACLCPYLTVLRPPPEITLSASPNPVDEGESVTITVTISEAQFSDVTIPLYYPNSQTTDTAVDPGDYTSLTSITIKANKKEGTGKIQTHDDNTEESDETFTVAIDESKLAATVVAGNPKEAEVTIHDNDTPRIRFTSSTGIADEDVGTHNVKVNISPAPGSDITVNYSLGGTATEDADYSIVGSGTVSVPENATSVNIPVVITDDNIDDDDETIILTLTGGTGYNLGTPKTHTLTITDNDDTPKISFDSSTGSVGEDVGTHNVIVNINPAPGSPIRVTYQLLGTTTEGKDYIDYHTGTNRTRFVSVPENATSVKIPIEIIDDNVDENDETLRLILFGFNIENPFEHTLTITDNDDPPKVSFDSSVGSVGEDGGTYEVEITIDPASGSGITLNYTLSGTATEDADYEIENSGTVSVSADAPSVKIPIEIMDDNVGEDDETVILTLKSGTGYTVGSPSEHTVTINDNDVGGAGITVAGTAAVTEGSTTTVDVKLAAAPTADVTVTFSDDGDSDVSWSGTALSGDALTFTPTNWNVAQTVILTAEEEDDFVNDSEILTLTASTSGGYNGETAEVAVTITDNDAAGITVSGTAAVTEGSITTVDVTLAAAPTGNMTVTFSDDGDSDVSWSGMALSGDALTFTPTNWNVAQTVTLTAAEDDDFVNDSEILTLTASTSGGYNGETAEVAVTITDNDAAGITVSGTAAVTEGSITTVDVTLAAAPTGNMTVTFSDDGDSDVSWSGMALSGDALTFTPTNWNVAQTVTLTAAEDDDFVNDSEILTLTASTSGGYNGETAEVTVTVTDNDGAGITVAGTAAVTEGSTTTVDVTLAAAPTADVAVTFSDDGDSDVSWLGVALSGDVLTFTTANWNMAQTVTLTAGQDDDFANDSETLTLTATGGGYDDVTATIAVTIIDNDDSPSTSARVRLSASSNLVDEGESVTITATLSEVLPDAVTIDLRDTPGDPPTEPGDYGPLPSITVAGGARTGSGTIEIRDDDVSEGDERFTVAIDELPPEVELGSPSLVEITITDDDPPPPVEVTLSAFPNLVEEGSSVTVTATLTGVLEVDVVVPLVYNDETGHPPESGDYTQVSGITIASGETEGSGQIQTSVDADSDDEAFIVALGDLPPAQLVPGRESSQFVTIQDTSTEVVVDLSAAPNPVDEGDEGVTVTATLSEVLDTDVVIPLVPTGGTADTQDYEALPPVQIEIKAGETSGTYPIFTVQDDVAEGDETFTVALGILPSGLVKGDRRWVELSITDDDAVGISALPSVSVAEQGENSFEISLTSEPSDDVTVTMSWPPGTDLTLSPPTRTFTPENWHEGQQVIFRAADDADVIDDQVEVILTASGGDYGGVSVVVSVTITDNDAPGIVAPASVTMEEGGERTLGVALAQMPSGPVTVTFIGHAGTDLSLNGSPLTFTPANWSQEQTVTLTAGQDDDFVDDTETLTLTASGGGYDEVEATVTVTIMDNDAAGIVAPEEVRMDEGGTYPLLVRLSAQPSGPATVTFSGHAGTDLALDKTSLTFTTADWQTPRPVTLTAMEDDDDYADETIGLTLTASGGGYDEVEAVTVTITDNDERPGPLTITIYDEQELENEGAIQLPIELSRPADQMVTVQYASTDGTAEAGEDYTTSRGIVIFDPGATRGVIEIEVTDDDLPEENETFVVTLSQPHNAIIARETGTGTILDDDGGTAILWVDDALVLEEEGMVRFRVSLSHPQRQLITAAYQTQDGTARAGEDYEASSGVVTLAPGTVEAMIAVPLLKDGLDWQEETFTMHLISSKHAEIAKAVGVATIQESTTVSEAVLEAYSARFVRTSSAQVVEALGERFRSGADGAACGAADRAEMAQLWYSASEWDPSLGELLSGCRMSASSYSGAFSVWGRGAFRQFNGRGADALTLSGEVTTGMLGADYRWQGGWLAGVLLAHSRGDGSFEVVEQSREITAGLTGVYPYVSYARAGWDVWLSAGAGHGQAEVLELEGDLVSRFGAMGVRGTLMSSGAIGLNYHGDVLVTDAELKDHDVTAEVYRVRAGVEANAKISEGLRPYVEASVRSDGGSAETGIGLEFGGGIRVDYPAWRLKGDVRTQGLVMHTADGFTEWGLSGALQVGSRSEGLMVRVRPTWGRGQGMSVYRQQTILDAVPIGANAHRTELELGYGIPWKDGTARSILGITQLSQGMMYRLGGELHPRERLTFSVFGLVHGRATTLGDLGINVRGSLRY